MSETPEYVGQYSRPVGASGTHHNDYGQEFIDVLLDDLDTETDRSTDAYSYRLRDPETEDELPLTVRHQDLMPAEDTSRHSF